MAPRPVRTTPVGNTDLFQPDRERPVRVRARNMPADTHFEPHRHAWAQVAYCASGIMQVTAQLDGPEGGKVEEVTYIIPPSRAVWIPPGARHSIHVLEDAHFRTLYIDASATPQGWSGCRVIVVSPLLRELVQALDTPLSERRGRVRDTGRAENPFRTGSVETERRMAAAPPSGTSVDGTREHLLTQLVLEELLDADILSLGVPMPHAEAGDKRLRALCEAVLRAPAERATLAEWSAEVGASERTMARLFRDELGTSYQQWRQQAILAHALPMLARGAPVSHVAAASGYASDSAFTAMFKGAMGQPPSHFQGRA